MTTRPRQRPDEAGSTISLGKGMRNSHQTLFEIAPWSIRCTWDLIDGRPEPTSVTIWRFDGRPVTASAIRSLPLGEYLASSRAEMSALAETIVAGDHPDRESQRPFVGTGPRRGQTHTPEELNAVAAVYREAYLNGQPVQAAVAAAFHIAPSTATKRIMKARAAGLLDGIGKRS